MLLKDIQQTKLRKKNNLIQYSFKNQRTIPDISAVFSAWEIIKDRHIKNDNKKSPPLTKPKSHQI